MARILNLIESIRFLEKYNIPTGEYLYIDNLGELKKVRSFLLKHKRIVLKIVSSKYTHKTEIGGVRITNNYQEAEEFIKEFLSKDYIEGILVQKYYKGIELFLAIKKDITFEKVFILGLGGIYFELYRDVCYLPFDFNLEELKRGINRTSLGRFISGFRGLNLNINKLYEFLSKFKRINEEFNVVEINPLIWDFNNFIPVDVRIEI